MEEKDFQPPDFAAQHIYGSKLSDKYVELFKAVDYEQVKPLNNLIWQIYRKEISLADFLAKATVLNLPGFKEKIFPGILRYDFLPIADYLEININDWLKYLSEKEKADLKVVSLTEWLKKFAQEERLELIEEEPRRLFAVASQYLKGLKDKNEIGVILAKPLKIGGLEFNEETAKKVAEDLASRLAQAEEQDEIITAQEVVVERTKNKEQRTSGIADISPRPKVETQNFASVQKFTPSIQLFDQTAEELIKKSGLTIPAELRQRFKIIIISRLKDVRKIPETRERLMAAPAVGGVGLKAEEAERVMGMVEEERKKISNSNPPAGGQIPNKSQISNIKTESAVSSAPVSPRPPLIPPDRGEKPSSPPPKISNIPARLASESVAGRQYPISSDIKPTAPSVLKIVPQEKVLPKVVLAPTPPPPPKPPATMAIPQTPAGRSKVEDVAYKPRLVGPIEELKEMSLVDFRRLSPQPKVTADKIYAKIELLAEEGYEKKIRGIKAWQASPVNVLYLEILNEGLVKAVPVAKIIEERQKAGRETLSLEEFKTVMELNRRLRF